MSVQYIVLDFFTFHSIIFLELQLNVPLILNDVLVMVLCIFRGICEESSS